MNVSSVMVPGSQTHEMGCQDNPRKVSCFCFCFFFLENEIAFTTLYLIADWIHWATVDLVADSSKVVFQMNVLCVCWNGTHWGLQHLEKRWMGKKGGRSLQQPEKQWPRGEKGSYWESRRRLAGWERFGDNGNHSRILAWRVPWTEEPGGLYSPWGRKESDATETI